MRLKRKLLFYGAMSIDGYLARDDHRLDWLIGTEGEEDTRYEEFYASVDTLIMGRNTYEQVLKLSPDGFPYEDKTCYIVSRTLQDSHTGTHIIREDVLSFIHNLKNEKGQHIWIVGGGELLQALLKEKLVDELYLQIAPVMIGKGIPLFPPTDQESRFSFQQVNQYKQIAEMHFVLKEDH
ncbi:dihydrofolate reductase [Bacillus altitudinis MN12]|nr:dihydrofolate reductase family protein [Bacillus altitudinis]MBR0585059.1 dihydrofolate reductase [Bacillus altitudinis MN12]MBR0596183.1 dihydrofolate reductase [Bacillus altitudinis C16B11]MBR0611620.1 dihydrofolate reductase [Bacillus altitudinis]